MLVSSQRMSTRTTSVCLLASGGLDSAVLLHHLLTQGTRVQPLYVRCGFRWEAAELHWLHRWLRAVRQPMVAELTIVELPMRTLYGTHWSFTGRDLPSAGTPDAAVYLPGRNILLTTCAGILCAQRGIGTIVLGTLRGNPFADASPRVLRMLARTLAAALGHPLRILTPLARVRKASLIRRARALPLHLTFSCLQPRGPRPTTLLQSSEGKEAVGLRPTTLLQSSEGKEIVGARHCGRCNKCAERRRAFLEARIVDPTRYAR